MPPQTRQGQLFVTSAPSGVGKTTIIRTVIQQCNDLRYSISCTTRHPRPEEMDGIDYHFVSHEKFREGIRTGQFVEWAEVHGQYYGTDRSQLEQWLAAGQDVLLDIDVQGARQVRCVYPAALTIFILPPSLQVLRDRLEKRGTETPEQLARRIQAAEREIQEAPWYDYIVLNDILDDAIADFRAILRAGHCRTAYNTALLQSFVLSREALD